MAGGLLVLALAGIGYLSLQDGKSPEPPPSNGIEGEETVQAEAEPSDTPATPASQADPESGEPEQFRRWLPIRRRAAEEPAAKPVPPKPAQPAPKRSARVAKPAPKPEPAGREAGAWRRRPAGRGDHSTGHGGAGGRKAGGEDPAGAFGHPRRGLGGDLAASALRAHAYTGSEIRGRGGYALLERVLKRGVGRLTVTATPRRAWVEVEGKRLAERTPVTLNNLPAGQLKVKAGRS